MAIATAMDRQFNIIIGIGHLEQVYLLVFGNLQPCARKPQVRTVRTDGQSQHPGIECHCPICILNNQTHMMNRDEFHQSTLK